MLTIRFNRVGRKNTPMFRIALQEHTVAPGGRHIALLGSYNPHTKETILKKDDILSWIGKGSQVSDSVYNLLVKEGVIVAPKRIVKIKHKPVEVTEDAKKADSEVKK